MAINITITDKHLSYTREEALQELQVFKQTARDYGQVERWVAERLPIFGGVVFHVGDKVEVDLIAHQTDLARLDYSYLHCVVTLDITRQSNQVDELENAFSILSDDTISKLEHRVNLFMELRDWPLVIANLVATYRREHNFIGTPLVLETVKAFMDPYITQHFPDLSFDKLRNLAGVDLLPEGYDALVNFVFDSRNKQLTQEVPCDLSL